MKVRFTCVSCGKSVVEEANERGIRLEESENARQEKEFEIQCPNCGHWNTVTVKMGSR